MASHYCALQQRNRWPESPAKAFAKLKQKVQTETKWRTGEPPTAASRPRDTDSDLSDRLQLGSSHSEAQALTLSPISSPPTSEEETPEGPSEARRGRTLRAFLESTAVSDPFLVNPPHIRDFKGCYASTIHGQSVCAEDGVFSPIKSRLRKRVQRPQATTVRKAPDVSQKHSNYNTSSLELTAEQPEERPEPPPQTVSTQKCFSFGLEPRLPTSPAQRYRISRTYVLNGGEQVQFPTCQTGKVNIRSASDCVTESERSQSESDLTGEASLRAVTPQPALCTEDGHLSNGYHARVVQKALMSPAKVFALMKDRENKVEPQKVPHHIRRNLNNADDVQLSDASLSTGQSVGETEASPERVSAEVPSDGERSEEMAQIPAAPAPLSALLQDQLLLKSPKVLIPKRQPAASDSKWPTHAKFPSENVIYLKKWCLRKLTKGLYIEGIHCSENIRWNSNIIVERISKSVLKTVSGRTYILVGKLMTKSSSDFPQWLLKKFVNGFPSNWKGLYEKFQSESRNRGKRKNGDGTNNPAKKKPEASSEKPVRKKPSTPPGDPGLPFGSAKLSRSGRLVVPPLDYWRGGRVLLDAYKNVTIHECYETSVVIPKDPTTQPACVSQVPGESDDSAPGAPTRGPRAKNQPAINSNPAPGATSKQRKSSKQQSVPLQRPQVSAGQRRKANTREKPDAPMETQSRSTRFSKNRLASEEALQMKNDPQQQSQAEKSSKKTSRRQTANKNTRTTSRTRRENQKSPEPAVDLHEAPQSLSADDDLKPRRRSLRRRAQSNKGRTAQSTSPPDLESSEEDDKEPRKKRNPAQKKAKPTGTKRPGASGPAEPLQKPTQSSQKQKAKQAKAATRQDADEDKWTEEEVQKLQEAVSYFPRHILGYWERVARMVETRSAEECHNQYTSMETSQQQPKKARRKKAEAPKSADVPLISARAGTLKRKQQVRQFLEAMPREDVEDAFSSAYMQNKRVELHSLGPNDDSDIMLSELEPLTPRSACFPEVKTPQCLHITPGMMGSPNRSNDEKYVYQLQKRMKKSRFDVQKRSRLLKKFTPTPSVKKPLRRCENTAGNDSFVVWEMFSGKDAASPDSDKEEEDFYFSDSN